MKSKLLNAVKKGALWSILVGFVLAVALVIGIAFGMNNSIVLEDYETLTVSVNKFAYDNHLDSIEEECEKAFADAGLNVAKEVKGSMYGDNCEVVYIFEKGTNLSGVTATLKASFNEKTSATEGTLAGSFVNVSTASETAKRVVANGYALRGAIASAVFAVLAFAYVTLRSRWDKGVVVAGAIVLGALLTTAVITLTRIPVTTSVAYAVLVGGLLSAVVVALNFQNQSDKTDVEEAVAETIAVKEILTLAVVCGGACVLLAIAGVIANCALAWFALMALVAVVCAGFIGLIYAPSMYVFVKEVADEKVALKDTSYKGAEKTSTKIKKVFQKKAVTEETVVEEKAEVAEESEETCSCGCCADCEEIQEAEEPEEAEEAEEPEEAEETDAE